MVYKGLAEPSKVPAAWHGWLHYTHEKPPVGEQPRHSWEKEHLPNLTGTALRYLPQGHASRPGSRARATADYTPWRPE